ncbi:putative ORFan [Tupanvirus deep ocean]|uniref:ORFan n=2 Tax=Tupanvirus TaxID=2094720 RepID=A0AC62A933_9VIRU|nr:putative ORFan [Tupanvirus deep ocean]QKU34291.1 putative ORFan [Tupanvirus deep ocean]
MVMLRFILQSQNVTTCTEKVIRNNQLMQQITSRDGYHIGVDFTKGFFLTLFTGTSMTSISYDGIYHIIENKYHGASMILYLLLTRIIALLNVITYVILFPFMFLFYVVAFFGSILVLILLGPLALCFDNIRAVLVVALVYAPTSVVSMLIILFTVAIAPVHILIPEFTVIVLKMHKWGYLLEYCY